jgi:hypothetical protein
VSAKKAQSALAGKTKGPMTKSPGLMTPSGGPSRPLNIQHQDGVAQERPNSAKKFGEPVLSLVERARGGSTAPGGAGKIIPD